MVARARCSEGVSGADMMQVLQAVDAQQDARGGAWKGVSAQRAKGTQPVCSECVLLALREERTGASGGRSASPAADQTARAQ